MSSAWDGLANDFVKTELPHYAVSKKTPEDSFFTDRAVAKNCVDAFFAVCGQNNLDVSRHVFVEPSAGDGCFYEFLPRKKIGIDINPRNAKIVKADFLTWRPKRREGKYAVVGNPPFGHRGALALAFIRRSFLFADIVAFILPMSFYSNGKGSNMKRVVGASLLHNEKLPKNSFFSPDTREAVAVNTVFQVWKKDGFALAPAAKKRAVFNDYDVSEYIDIYTCCSVPNRYCGLGRGRSYHCFVASTFYGGVNIVESFDDVLYGSGYGMIIKKKKREVLRALRSIDWTNYCSEATSSCRHIRMYHIRKALGERGYGRRV